jgi:hypothetical protein
MTDRNQIQKMIDALVNKARAMSDDDRVRLAAARRAVDESFHVGAWRAAIEMLPARAEMYAAAWLEIGPAFVPEQLLELVDMGDRADPDELLEWQEVARLVRLGIDDELLALLTADSIPPPHLRQLHRSWATMLEKSHPSKVDSSDERVEH